MNTKIIEIRNGVAKVEWRKNSEPALVEADKFMAIGDELPEQRLVFNGGDPRYIVLCDQFSALFDAHGNFLGELPDQCVRDCSASGPVDGAVAFWLQKLDFTVPRDQAIKWLREFGAWPLETDKCDKGLNQMSDAELATKVLWLACCDLNEQGEWFGLIH